VVKQTSLPISPPGNHPPRPNLLRAFLEDTPFAARFAVNGLGILLIIVLLAGASLWGLGQLRQQIDHLHFLTLASQVSLGTAESRYAELQRNVESIANPSTSAGHRAALITLSQQTLQETAFILERYQAEWISSASPAFTAALARLGQADLQQLEAEVLQQLQTSHQAVLPFFERLSQQALGGRIDPRTLEAVQLGYDRVRADLRNLIEINNQFATLSHTEATAAYQRSRDLFIAVLLGGLALAALFNGLLLRSLQQRSRSLLRGAEALQQGRYDHLTGLGGRDELGVVARTLDSAVVQLRGFLTRQEEERQRGLELQQNVRRFLDIATQIASGDLTKRGGVSNDALGSVVDAVNLTVEEISFLLKDVRQAAESVSQNAAQMDQLTASIASGALLQAQEVSQVQNQSQQVAHGIRQMAQSANVTAQAARQTLESAQLGRQAVTQTLSGMSDIRMEMQAVAENIAALAQRSAEIEDITKVLEDFASQTNLLALNATFEAAGAGAAGRRFAVVANEIRRLAEESARETSRVSSLVQQVQSDIARVVGLVQDGVREVETGYGVATSAGSRLEEIASLAAQSAGLAQEISGLAQSQVSAVERVDQAVQKIAHTAQQTGHESQEGRRSAGAMRILAEQLSSSLGRFRLPD
jgi:methyl-accepting chemotaxis protein